MYAFEPKFPLDHVLSFYRAIKSGDYERGDLLILAGAITGEVGALLKSNTIALSGDVAALADVLSFEACLEKVSMLENSSMEEANFDPGVWVPIVLKLIELWLSRKGR